MTTLFMRVFVFLLPLGAVGSLGWLTIPFQVVIGTMFVILDGISTLTENPFAGNFNDVPMDALCRMIEIDLRDQLGEAHDLEALEADEFGVVV